MYLSRPDPDFTMCITTGTRSLESTDSMGSFAALYFTEPISSTENPDGQTSTRSYNVDLHTPLLAPSNDVRRTHVGFGDLPQEMHTCQNRGLLRRKNFKSFEEVRNNLGIGTIIRHHWRFNNEPGSIGCLGREMFARIYNIAFFSGITACHNIACQKRKEAFKAAAPDCTWGALRDFILICLGCRLDKEQWGFIQNTILPGIGDRSEYGHAVPKSFCIDIRGVFDFCRWSERIARPGLTESDLGTVPRFWRLDKPQALKIWQTLLFEYENDALDISQKCHTKGICPNRLWNASFHNSNTSIGVCHLGKAVLTLEHSPNQKEDHGGCTAQYCLRAHDNSTLAEQAHKCPTKCCGPDVIFSANLLNEGSKKPNEYGWFNTAWSLELPNVEPRVMELTETNYMAISHVWADGTGVGLKTPGHVNPCLYEYFSDIAKKLGCNGLWWDTISIPSERTARGAALERMLDNFENASLTLVHDEDLVNFPWRDDGSPAIALVLSSWFTRGWTAAELWASRGHPVKVLFKDSNDPTGLKPLIKDLDDDIFAADVGEWLHSDRFHIKNDKDNGYFTKHSGRDMLNPAGTIPMQGYIVAAEAMKRIRHPFRKKRNGLKFSDLLSVLSRRTTSWEKDRMLIAGLMCQERNLSDNHQLIGSNTPGPKITQLILGRFGRIEVTDLLHSDVPIATYGPWSWCPQSIFQFGQLYHSSALSDMRCTVWHNGSLYGEFQAYEVLEDDVIIPCGSHPAGRVRVSVALSNRGNCLLLSTPCTQNYHLYILAQPVHVDWDRLHCRWVGCVRLQSSLDLKSDDDVGKRRYFTLMYPRYFTFGRDAATSGRPLSPLSYDAVSRALESFLRGNKYPDPLRKPWCSDWREKNIKKWEPQLIHFHAELLPYTQPDPNALLAWDFDNKENRVQESFFELLGQQISVGGARNGRVNLCWSFPFRNRIRCTAPTIAQFNSEFLIVPKIEIAGKSHVISLGKDTFDLYVKPLLDKKDGSMIIWSYKLCRQCDRCQDWLLSNLENELNQLPSLRMGLSRMVLSENCFIRV
ncbi:uncharacterized protein F4807DRAFT_236764 [Annulohypoxylon truncatum]|uniref:uncharacterized protein n=1 Tax=Annulohypoxylon truncatum TaxID=327061 RepID=UPI002008A9A9|nr:uncharacterized protein F4807DRAFT_236764 [Annulohypoxylon truncatum]KAI1206344.1 hypothetical protein F4807DRAFT_236764 [Annulohypoxylon truncatum]